LTSFAEGDQLYVNGPVPVIDAFIVVFVPCKMVDDEPALTTGRAFTVTIETGETVLVHPLAFVVTTV